MAEGGYSIQETLEQEVEEDMENPGASANSLSPEAMQAELDRFLQKMKW